ncbi:ribonuclease P protein component [Bartonella sp. F2]|nr:ribonuclease P protein component [Bartonella sp. F02]
MKKKHFGRIRKRVDFLAARTGEKRRGPLFLLEVKSREQTGDMEPPIARIGFTVTRKNGNAVQRNRIKRRLREAVRVGLKDNIKAGNDYVIIARKEVLDAPFSFLINELNRRMKSTSSNKTTKTG